MVRAEPDICVPVVEMRHRRIELLFDRISDRSELHARDRRRRQHPSSGSHCVKQERICDRDIDRDPNCGVECWYDHDLTAPDHDDCNDDDDTDYDFDDTDHHDDTDHDDDCDHDDDYVLDDTDHHDNDDTGHDYVFV